MIFLNLFQQRIILVSIGQSWPIIYLSLFAYMLLKRAKNRSTITLSTFFSMLASAYFFAFISIFTVNTPFAYSIYMITWFLLLYSHFFFILFAWLLIQIKEHVALKKYIIFMVFYGILITGIIWVAIFNHGIQYDETTGWTPIFSAQFAIINWMFIGFLFVLPEFIMAFRLVKIFKGSKVVIRIKLFLISSFLEFAVISLIVLYNASIFSQDYRPIHFYINLPLGMIAAYCIYRSFGKRID
jgi:hypothetical protein